MPMPIPVAQPAAVEQQAMVEQRAVTFADVLEPAGKIGKLLNVKTVDLANTAKILVELSLIAPGPTFV